MNEPIPRLYWSDFVYKLQQLLNDHAVNTPLYLVGGAVRDAYMRKGTTDLDIAVDGDAVRFARQVADWLSADIYIMDAERGVARVFVSGENGKALIDFARFRGATLKDDLYKRDFTINAMAADLLGDLSHLIDPLDGLRDLRAKVLTRCAPQALSDDPVRSLRAIRQSTHLGLKIHPDTLADIRMYAGALKETSPERIRDEFFKLLALNNASRAIRVLKYLDLLGHILPHFSGAAAERLPSSRNAEVWTQTMMVTDKMGLILSAINPSRTDNSAATFGLGMLVIQLDRYRAELQRRLGRMYGNGRRHREILLLAALLHKVEMAHTRTKGERSASHEAQGVAKTLRLSAEEDRRLTLAIASYRRVLDGAEWNVLDRHRFWFQLGESGMDAILLASASYLGAYGAQLQQSAWLQLVDNITSLLDTWFHQQQEVVNPALFLDGAQIMTLLDVDQGPVVGTLLNVLREAQVTGEVTSVHNARDYVLRYYKSVK